MKTFLLELEEYEYGDDYALVIIAKNEERAKEIACKTSNTLKHYMGTSNVKITTINMNKEQCVLRAFNDG